MNIVFYLLIGLVVGAFSGLLGVGGGIILIPALTVLLGFSQPEAQGTTLAMMVPPIGLFAAIQYYKQGYVRIDAAIPLAITFAIGAWIISSYISRVPQVTLQRIFGVFLCFVAGHYLLSGFNGGWGWLAAGLPSFMLGAALKKKPRKAEDETWQDPGDYSI